MGKKKDFEGQKAGKQENAAAKIERIRNRAKTK